MIDLFIALFSIVMVVFVFLKKLKMYKKNGFAAFCNEDCSSCGKSCSINKK